MSTQKKKEGSSKKEKKDKSPDKKVKKDSSKLKKDSKPSSKKETKQSPKKEKKQSPKKESPTKGKKRKVTDSPDDDSDDEPLMKKMKAALPPTNAEIKVVIKKILDGADLEQITMKTVCKQVYAKYPDFDLTGRKDFIKSTVKQIIV